MKIALLTPTFSAFSGIDRVVELQAEELINKGNKVTIFTLKAGIKPKTAKIVEMGMPNKQFFERMYRLFFFLDFPKIKKYGKMLKGYDQVISHFYPMNWIAIYAKKHYKTRYVYYNHGIAYPELFSNILERIYMGIFKKLTNYTIKKSDSVISISEFLRKELNKETGIKSKVIHDKIDTKRFHKGIPRQKMREKYGLGKNPVCLYVGRISPHKGIHLLIQAFNLVLKEMPNAKLLIVGKKTFGNYTKQLEKLASKVNPNAIIFTGFVPDQELPYYYTDADLYTTATLWEGYDLPIVEAAACGTPAIAFDIGAHPEIMKQEGLVKVKDVHMFKNKIISFLEKQKYRKLFK